VSNALSFLNAWGLLRYNLVTNDGERFVARDAYAYIEELAQRISEQRSGQRHSMKWTEHFSMDQQYRTPEERIEALELKVEKLDRIVYRLWKDLKAIVNSKHRQAEA
jgi:hypothetical protein